MVIIDANLSSSKIQNNIFYKPSDAGIRMYASRSYSNNLISNNLTTAAAMVLPTDEGGSPTSLPSGFSVTSNAVNTDPLFAGLTGYDFHLQAASPARATGLSLANVLYDLDGCSRPVGQPYNLGAYQQ